MGIDAQGKNLKRSKGIDSLRALAVVVVVIYHFFPTAVPYGYRGVDIFFVISGFVITISLRSYQQKKNGNFFKWFWGRRIARLMPALIVVTLLSLAIHEFVSRQNAQPTRQSAIAGLLGIENFYQFYVRNDYWGLLATSNPFTHLWSLGVEEQFYLVFATCVQVLIGSPYAASKFRRKSIWLSSLCLMSFCFFLFMHHSDELSSFYLLPGRAWEFLLGITCAINIGSTKLNKYVQFKKYVSVIMFLLMLSCLFIVKNEVVGLTGVCLASTYTSYCVFKGERKGLSSRFQDGMIWQLIGRASYSIYLWHWPLLTIFQKVFILSTVDRLLIICLVFLFGTISFRFIEQPFKKERTSDITRYSFALPAMALFVSVILCWFAIPKATNAINLFNVNGISTVPDRGSFVCLFESNQECWTSNDLENGKTLWLYGDSHAEMFASTFANVAIKMNMNVSSIRWSRNPDDLETVLLRDDLDFSNYKVPSFEKIVDNAKARDVVLISFFKQHLNFGGRDGFLTANETQLQSIQEINWALILSKYLQVFENKDINVILVNDVPFLHNDLSVEMCAIQLKIGLGRSSCSVSFVDDELNGRRQSSINRRMESHFPNVYVFDATSNLFPKTSIYEPYNMETKLFYYVDSNHISRAGAELLSPEFTALLKSVIR